MRDRGFTLIELMIAGVLSAGVVFSGFLALSEIQRSSARQTEAQAIVGEARLALEVMAGDIRTAGDSLDLLPEDCLGDLAHATAEARCPAVLEAHPWRLALARNAWRAKSGEPEGRRRTDDLPPPATRRFEHEPGNVVLYRFVPRGEAAELTDGDGRTRQAVLGRIERVVNPYGFARPDETESPPRVTVLLDDVLLDDRMRVDPADPDQVDHRYDHALFLYQVLTRQGEFTGDPDLVGRATGLDRTFLTPPLRFFPAAAPAELVTEPPYAPNHPAEVVGLEKTTKSYPGLLPGSDRMNANDPGSDLRRILDRNRIRTVRIAFKVVGPEHPDVADGLDLDGNRRNGTARVWSFGTTVEIKPLSPNTTP
jgi:prepilin-type N-terminal cleavage/methylation domain-containing protein